MEGGEKARTWTKSKEGESGREVINQEEKERGCITMDHMMHCVSYMCGSHDALCGVHVWIT